MIITDEIVIICSGCKVERQVKPEVVAQVRSADDLISRVLENVPPCPFCSAKTCDVRIRLPPEKQPS